MLITAFEGWNDAGSAATTAVEFLIDAWDAVGFADIDPEEFFDFSVSRPTVSMDEDGDRIVEWPGNRFLYAHATPDLDVVLLLGTEPQLRWRSFCQHVLSLADALEVRLVVSLGALLAEVPHTRPVSVYGAAYDRAVAEQLALTPSSYEGPTGVVGVLHAAYRDHGLASASLWAAVPTYVPTAPSPKAALALVARVTSLLGTTVDADDLSEAAADYENHVDAAVAIDEDSLAYVARLEQEWDDDDEDRARAAETGDGARRTGQRPLPAQGDADADLVTEIERYLRDQQS